MHAVINSISNSGDVAGPLKPCWPYSSCRKALPGQAIAMMYTCKMTEFLHNKHMPYAIHILVWYLEAGETSIKRMGFLIELFSKFNVA